jgi:hypothetical protein
VKNAPVSRPLGVGDPRHLLWGYYRVKRYSALKRPVERRWIPLFHGKKQQKTLFSAFRRPNATLQVIDSIRVRLEFRYGA